MRGKSVYTYQEHQSEGRKQYFMKDLTATWGHFWCIMDDEFPAAATATVIFDNCNIKMDFADDSAQDSHIIEDQVGWPCYSSQTVQLLSSWGMMGLTM